MALAYSIDGLPHAALAAAPPERLARLVVHRDGHLGVTDLGVLTRQAQARQEPLYYRRIAEQDKLPVGMAGGDELQRGNDHLGSDISPHRVNCQGSSAAHDQVMSFPRCRNCFRKGGTITGISANTSKFPL